MNIFVTDPNPFKCANTLDDKRVVKMVLETCQLLSTAMIVSGGTGPYKPTHINHPCSIWARTSQGNYAWLLDHFDGLLREYYMRYNRTHKCQDYYETLWYGIQYIPAGLLTPFINCTLYKEVSDVYVAYQWHLFYKWQTDKRIPTWAKQTRSLPKVIGA